jgi:hypothetical protein
VLRLRLPATFQVRARPCRTGITSPEFRTRFHRKQERSFKAWPRRSSAPDRKPTSAPNAHHKTAIYNTLRPDRSISEPVASAQCPVASKIRPCGTDTPVRCPLTLMLLLPLILTAAGERFVSGYAFRHTVSLSFRPEPERKRRRSGGTCCSSLRPTTNH